MQITITSTPTTIYDLIKKVDENELKYRGDNDIVYVDNISDNIIYKKRKIVDAPLDTTTPDKIPGNYIFTCIFSETDKIYLWTDTDTVVEIGIGQV